MLTIKRLTLYDSDGIEIIFHFNRSFSTFWNIFVGLCTKGFYSWGSVRGDLKSSVS